MFMHISSVPNGEVSGKPQMLLVPGAGEPLVARNPRAATYGGG
jgi:hypothetical protein